MHCMPGTEVVQKFTITRSVRYTQMKTVSGLGSSLMSWFTKVLRMPLIGMSANSNVGQTRLRQSLDVLAGNDM